MRPATPNTSTRYPCPSSGPCASSAATSPGRRVFPPDRLATNLRHALAEILARPNPARRLRTYPRVTKRASGSKFPSKHLDHNNIRHRSTHESRPIRLQGLRHWVSFPLGVLWAGRSVGHVFGIVVRFGLGGWGKAKTVHE